MIDDIIIELLNLSGKNVFIYCALFVIMLYILSKYNIPIYINILLIFIFIYFYHNYKKIYNIDQSTKLDNMINNNSSLQKYTNILLKPDILEWIRESYKLKQYNVLEYNKTLKLLDNFYYIYHIVDEGVPKSADQIKNITHIKKETLNTFHSIIHSLSSNNIIKEYNYLLNQLNIILTKDYAHIISVGFKKVKDNISIDSGLDIFNNIKYSSYNDNYNNNYNYFH